MRGERVDREWKKGKEKWERRGRGEEEERRREGIEGEGV